MEKSVKYVIKSRKGNAFLFRDNVLYASLGGTNLAGVQSTKIKSVDVVSESELDYVDVTVVMKDGTVFEGVHVIPDDKKEPIGEEAPIEEQAIREVSVEEQVAQEVASAEEEAKVESEAGGEVSVVEESERGSMEARIRATEAYEAEAIKARREAVLAGRRSSVARVGSSRPKTKEERAAAIRDLIASRRRDTSDLAQRMTLLQQRRLSPKERAANWIRERRIESVHK